MECRYSAIQTLGTLDGPGVRFVLFLQGCPLRCGYCHNPETRDASGGGVTFYDMHKNVIEKELQVATWDVSAAEKGGYAHFMLKEICEQPDALKKTINPRIKNGLPDFSECGLTDEKLRSYRHIYVVGCGSAQCTQAW